MIGNKSHSVLLITRDGTSYLGVRSAGVGVLLLMVSKGTKISCTKFFVSREPELDSIMFPQKTVQTTGFLHFPARTFGDGCCSVSVGGGAGAYMPAQILPNIVCLIKDLGIPSESYPANTVERFRCWALTNLILFSTLLLAQRPPTELRVLAVSYYLSC